jgi:hypothetical protein
MTLSLSSNGQVQTKLSPSSYGVDRHGRGGGWSGTSGLADAVVRADTPSLHEPNWDLVALYIK